MNQIPTNQTWYLLYAGVSEDGMGEPGYVGRTTDIKEAKKHYEEVTSDLYSTGKVIAVTDKTEVRIFSDRDWGKAIASTNP